MKMVHAKAQSTQRTQRMWKALTRYLLGILVIFLSFLCSCSKISGKLLVMEGNFHNSRGSYTEAIASYQRALEYTEAEPYSEFGLGSVYFNLGEEQAALNRFAAAEKALESLNPSACRELRYRIHFNTGVVLFSEGDFSGAVDSFRKALKTDGGKKDAKRNLELSIRSLSRENNSGSSAHESGNESMAVLFEYVRQKEYNHWKSHDWDQEENLNIPDY